MRSRSARHGPSTAFSSCLTSPVGTVYSSTFCLYGSGKFFVFTFRYFCLQPVFIDFISSFNVQIYCFILFVGAEGVCGHILCQTTHLGLVMKSLPHKCAISQLIFPANGPPGYRSSASCSWSLLNAILCHATKQKCTLLCQITHSSAAVKCVAQKKRSST